MKVIDFKNASCKHCYKCVRSCSVKAIKVKDAQATIMDDHCVLCGTCLEVCPQNAKTFVSDLEKVRAFITMGEKTIVSLAPAYLCIFDYFLCSIFISPFIISTQVQILMIVAQIIP